MPENRVHQNEADSASRDAPAASAVNLPPSNSGNQPPPANSTDSDGRQNIHPTKCQIVARFLRRYGPIIISFILAIEVGIQAWIYNEQRKAMNAQRDAMNQQVKASEKSLEDTNYAFRISRRPWVALDGLKVVSSLPTDPKGTARVVFSLSNRGNSPAFDVVVAAHLVDDPTDHQLWPECNPAFLEGLGPGEGAILPPSAKPDDWSRPVGAREGKALTNRNSVYLVGCIGYDEWPGAKTTPYWPKTNEGAYVMWFKARYVQGRLDNVTQGVHQ